MNLRQQAAADLKSIMADDADGFGWPVTVTAPSGAVAALTGFSSDIHQVIDPGTGEAVSGRFATVSLNIGALAEKLPGEGLPKSIPDAAGKPWIVEFEDVNGAAYVFAVAQANPDRAIGNVACILEPYERGA